MSCGYFGQSGGGIMGDAADLRPIAYRSEAGLAKLTVSTFFLTVVTVGV